MRKPLPIFFHACPSSSCRTSCRVCCWSRLLVAGGLLFVVAPGHHVTPGIASISCPGVAGTSPRRGEARVRRGSGAGVEYGLSPTPGACADQAAPGARARAVSSRRASSMTSSAPRRPVGAERRSRRKMLSPSPASGACRCLASPSTRRGRRGLGPALRRSRRSRRLGCRTPRERRPARPRWPSPPLSARLPSRPLRRSTGTPTAPGQRQQTPWRSASAPSQPFSLFLIPATGSMRRISSRFLSLRRLRLRVYRRHRRSAEDWMPDVFSPPRHRPFPRVTGVSRQSIAWSRTNCPRSLHWSRSRPALRVHATLVRAL